MQNRFEQLYNLPKDLYSDGSPIILSNGVLSKDSQTGNIVIQLKFHNVSAQVIKALKVSVVPYDVAGTEIDETCDYQYLDLSVKPGEYFGANKAIIVSNAVSRSFTVKNITVIMESGEIKDVDMPMAPLPEPITLQNKLTDSELVKQYQLSVNDKATYVPQEMFSLWQCSCGEWNSGATCTRCHAGKSNVFSSFDIPALSNQAKTRLEKEAADEAERKAFEQQQAEELEKEKQEKQARLKKAGIITAIVVAVVALVLIIIFLIIPAIRQGMSNQALHSDYMAAEDLLENGQYEEAIAAFEDLGDYDDSPDRINECRYKMAEDLMNNEQYSEAILILENLISYSDSRTLLQECRYAMAQELMETGQYEEAIKTFDELGDYEDSKFLSWEAQYLYAQELLNEKNYEEAIAEFEDLENYNYKNSHSYLLESQYLYGQELFEEKRYEEATAIFKNLEDYEESQSYLNESRYLYAQDLYEKGMYEEAKSEFQLLGDYKDSKNIIQNIGDYGSCGSDVTWMLDSNNALIIAGSGAMENYVSGRTKAPWQSFRSDITSVVVKSGVTSIGDRAFYDCDNLTSVTIPDSVTSIGEYAFFDCDSLSNVNIPNSVTKIDEWSFESCNNLTSITIPNSVTSIDRFAFHECGNLTSVVIPVSVTSIAYGAFALCNSLRDIYYTGSESDWTNVNIATFNDSLTSATVHYNST